MFLHINPTNRTIDVFDCNIIKVGMMVKRNNRWVFCKNGYCRELTDREQDDLARQVASINSEISHYG